MQSASFHLRDGLGRVGQRPRTRGLSIKFRWLIFVSLLIASVTPVIGLYKWMERSAIEKEIGYVEENHLIIARNLSNAMDRYARDVGSIVSLIGDSLVQAQPVDFDTVLEDFDLSSVTVLDRSDRVVAQYPADARQVTGDLSSEQLSVFRDLAGSAPGAPVFSGVQTFQGAPHLFVVRALPNGLMTLAVVEPRYLIALQQSIKFGERGHSMIVDQHGRVIAHPNADWQATSKDASKLSVVQSMMAGETGVATFFSPPMQADMISGFTHVPATGWGVMVPQPISELVARAKATEADAFTILALEAAVLVMVSWWLSSLIARPINTVVETARSLSAGNLSARAEIQSGPVTVPEANLLATSFNKMVADLEVERDRISSALDAARAGMRSKSRFLAVMSHEVRTPMHGLMGVLELLEETERDGDKRALLVAGHGAAKNMVGLLDGVLDYAKLEADAERGEISTFTPAAVTQEVVDLLQPLAAKKGLALKTDASDAPLSGNPQLIKQILFNLVGNALKFTEAGEVQILSHIKGADADQTSLVLTVRDTGIGIAEHLHEKIFEEFSQADRELSRKYEGTGLGLAIVSKLVKTMQGDITVESAPGQGATFQVVIPVTIGVK